VNEEPAASANTSDDSVRGRLPQMVATVDPDGARERYERPASAAIRLIASVLGLVAVEVLAELLPTAEAGLQHDLRELAGSWAGGLGALADAIATAWSLVVILVAVAASVIAKRPRQVATSLVAAGTAAAVVIAASRLAGSTPGEVISGEWQLAIIAAALATAAATSTVFVTPVARWSTGIITAFALVGSLGGETSFAGRLIAVLAGEAVGSAVALILGAASRRVVRSEIVSALERARLPVSHLEPLDVDARGSQPWFGELATGRPIFVKVESGEELRAAQLFRAWRRVRLRDSGDRRPPATPEQSAEHQAFVAERASASGARTPKILSIGRLAGGRGVFTVFETVHGVTFDEADDLSEEVLRGAWSQVQILRRASIAHRDLRAANLMVVDGEPWVIDFGFAEVAASDDLLSRDLAELLCSTAVLVGPERAVDAAVSVLGPDVLAEAIPWIQPLAVSTSTRSTLDKASYETLRELVRAAAGISAPELPQMQRITWKGVATTVALGVAVWTLLPQLTSGIDWGRALEADRPLIGFAVLASFATYVGAALSVKGSVPEEVPLAPTFLAQLAGSFVNRVTPAKVGSLALNVRFLTKQGVDNAVAATGLAVSTAAGTVVHVLIALIVVLWAGNVGFPGVSAPPPWVWIAAVAVIVLAVLLVLAVPPARRWWTRTVVPSARRSIRSFLEVIRSPRNLLLLLGGSATVTLGNLVAFTVSARAFGIGLSVASLGVAYLFGSALASAAPTPGGLGATEAALVAGLAVLGVPENDSVPAVLLFRLATFWLPIIPGWLCLIVLQRRGDL
jgi:glycosyltransferase 2 family protein